MDKVLKLLDGLWNLRFLTGIRTIVAKALIAGVGLYIAISTGPLVLGGVTLGNWSKLPDLPPLWAAGILGYLAHKVDQFVKEHAPK